MFESELNIWMNAKSQIRFETQPTSPPQMRRKDSSSKTHECLTSEIRDRRPYIFKISFNSSSGKANFESIPVTSPFKGVTPDFLKLDQWIIGSDDENSVLGYCDFVDFKNLIGLTVGRRILELAIFA